MDIDQARTFLSISAHGSFLEASKRLHVTQSTVSARIRNLENTLGVKLFVRNRAGAVLTPAGRRFLKHAKTLVLTMEQAQHDVGLPDRFRGGIRVGARIALWDNFLPSCVSRFRKAVPDISIQSEIGFEEDLMRQLVEGTLDIGLMYTPYHAAEMIVEELFDENLVLVSSDPAMRFPDDDYVYIEWGPGFYARHREHYPDLERPAQVANIGWLGIQLILARGGSCYLPQRIARPLIITGKLHQVDDAPEFSLPAYMVFPRHLDNDDIRQLLEIIRDLSSEVAQKEYE